MCRCGRASCSARRSATSSTPTASSSPTRRRRSGPARCTRRCSREFAPPGVARLQLERVPDQLHAGQGRDVARRHRLRRAARGQGQVAHRRQGRLRRDAARAEGAVIGAVRRRRSASRGLAARRRPAWFYCQWALEQDEPARDAAGRRRRAGAQLRRSPTRGDRRPPLRPSNGSRHAGGQRRSRSPACR